MKAIGYVICKVCNGLYRGYAPRGWKPGNELCTWAHSVENGFRLKCDGSYCAGIDTHLDSDLSQVHNESPQEVDR